MGLTTTRTQIQLPPLHEGQLKIAQSPARFKVVANGRRYGKTALGVWLSAKSGLEGKRIWWVAITYKVAQEGWDMLRMFAQQVPGAKIRQADREIRWPGGGRTQVRSADNPQSLRGAGLDGVVLDEAAFMHPDTWGQALRPALADKRGWALFISTPRGRNWFYKLWKNAEELEDWEAFRAPTSDNPFISMEEIRQAQLSMTSTSFNQEFMASFEEVEGALWKADWIDNARIHAIPADVDLIRVVVAIDPAVTANDMSDETAICVAALGSDGHYYILVLQSYKLSPSGWARKAIGFYEEFQADCIVGEVNNGGDLVDEVIQHVAAVDNKVVNYKAVHASRGKVTRAEPVAGLDENGKIHHVGYFPSAEDQMFTFPIENERDDLVDARVWAISEIMAPVGVLTTF